MISYLGSLSVGAVVPAYELAILRFMEALNESISEWGAEQSAIMGDIQGLMADVLSLEGDLASIVSLRDDITGQILGAIATFVSALTQTLQSLVDGSMLFAIQQAILGGPAALKAGLESTLMQVVEKILALNAKIFAIQGRVTSLWLRIAAIVARLEALALLLGQIQSLQEFLAVSGVHLWMASGPTDVISSEIGSAFVGGVPAGGTPADPAWSLVLVTTVPSVWAVISKVFRVV